MTARKLCSIVIMIGFFAGLSAVAEQPGASPNYLALGDSVPFGYINQAGFEYVNAENFVSYADWLSIGLSLSDVNAACPGETTGSFLSTQAPDNGCRLYRAHAPLHVSYGSSPTQFAYATNFLQQNGNTAVVTIQLGSDDVFLLEQQCNNDPQCIAAGLPQVLTTAGTNMATILAGLRATGYDGTIVIVNYYSIDYSNQSITLITSELNQAITASAHLFDAVVADVFSAFQAATQQTGGRTCLAGLLNPKTGVNSLACDVHPSQSGHKLIAQVISGVIQPSKAKSGK